MQEAQKLKAGLGYVCTETLEGEAGKEGKSVYELGRENMQFGSAFCNETAELSQEQEYIPVFLYLVYT